MLAMGALLAIGGHISAGAMIASNALMGNALRPVGVLTQAWRPWRSYAVMKLWQSLETGT